MLMINEISIADQTNSAMLQNSSAIRLLHLIIKNKNKTTHEARDKHGPYAGSVEKEISEVSSNPCLRRFVQIFKENLGNKPTSLGEDNETHFNFSSFQIQA